MAMKRRRIIVLVIASVSALALLPVLLSRARDPQVRGPLSNKDVRAITKELHRVRSRAEYVSLSRLHFGVFWQLAKQNFRVESVEGDGTYAIAQCQEGSKWQHATYAFTNYAGLWCFTTVSHYESFAK